MKNSILVAALAVIGAGVFYTPSVEAHDHHYWGNNRGYNYGCNPYMNNRSGFFGNSRHQRREIRREQRRAMRQWDNRLGRWF